MDPSNEIEKAAEVLKGGGVILCPTDTIWGISAMASSEKAFDKVMKIKNRPQEKRFILLFNDMERVRKLFRIFPEEKINDELKSGRPTTFILSDSIGLPEYLTGPNRSLAFRLVTQGFCSKLISYLNAPIISTSANLSGKPSPVNCAQIETEVLDAVDYIYPYDQHLPEESKPSRILRIDKGIVEVLRP